MKNAVLVIDVARCHGCNNCFMACKDEFVGNDFSPYSRSQPRHGQKWMNIQVRERGRYPMVDAVFLPMPCQHCENAPCEKAGGGAVMHESNTGAVIIHTLNAKGNKRIADSCPYHAVYWNEEEQLGQKCNLCSHLLNHAWEKPRCVMACPTETLTFHRVEESEMDQFIQENELSVYHPEYNTHPHVFYKNLYRFTKQFIGGTVTLNDDCVEGALVMCRKAGEEVVQRVHTNTFGDFKVDGLDAGRYELKVAYPGCADYIMEVEVEDKAVYLDVLALKEQPDLKHDPMDLKI